MGKLHRAGRVLLPCASLLAVQGEISQQIPHRRGYERDIDRDIDIGLGVGTAL